MNDSRIHPLIQPVTDANHANSEKVDYQDFIVKEADRRKEVHRRIMKEFNKRRQEAVQFKSKRIGRNEKCPCGSGKKFKKCCMNVQ